MKAYVKEIIDKIVNQENIYKEIDLEKDICNEKSDLYFINEDKELQFICGSPKSLLDYDGYFFNKPNDCRPRTHLEFKPVESFYENRKFYHSRYILNNPVNKHDIIYFKFNNGILENGEFFKFNFFDKLTLEANKKIKIVRDMVENNQYFELTLKSTMIERHYISINKNELYIKAVDKGKDIICVIDINESKVYINGIVKNFTNIDFKDILNNICLIYGYIDSKEKIINIEHKDLTIGTGKGIIYINPFKLDKSLKFKMIYKGHINAEFYSYEENKWKALDDKRILKKNSILNIRLKLNTFDILNKIFLVSI